MTITLTLPEFGDADQQATIVSVAVSLGDKVSKNDTLLELETDKAMMEVPCEHSGTITAIHFSEGDSVKSGASYMELSADESADKVDNPKLDKIETDSPTIDPTPTLAPAETSGQSLSKPALSNDAFSGQASNKGLAKAGPGARRLSRELGLDLSVIPGTGNRGTIVKADIKNYVRQSNVQQGQAPSPAAARELPDFSKFGEVRREALSPIAQATSRNMQQAWATIPHAWLQEKIDITDLEAWRQDNKRAVKDQGGSLTITVLIAKAAANAMNKFPLMNSSFDEVTNELVYKDYIDLGIAVDTDKGLVVPVLRGVDQKGLIQLSIELSELAEKAHSRKLKPNDMQGGGLTISNLGGLGLTSIFPIVNWPQVAILGVAASETVPRFQNGEFVPRQQLTLTLGFDHRVINGADGARFLVYFKQLLEDPRLMLL